MLKSVGRLLVALLLVLAVSPAAFADPGQPGDVTPCENHYICIDIEEPGGTPNPGQTTGGTSGGGDGGVQMCSWNGQQWPCWDNDLGWFNTSDGCYYHRSDPQPPADDSAWAGHTSADGAVYEVNCRGVGGQLTPKPPMFFAQPPGGAPPPDNAVDLALRALRKMRFDSPELHAAPGGTAVVSMPVWFWYTPTATTSGARTETVKGRTISVTVKAVLTSVSWDTGDGSDGATCTGEAAVTPYRTDVPQGTKPPCGYTYLTSSAGAGDNAFYVKATLHWEVQATRSDSGGTVFRVPLRYPVVTEVPLRLQVAEVQALG